MTIQVDVVFDSSILVGMVSEQIDNPPVIARNVPPVSLREPCSYCISTAIKSIGGMRVSITSASIEHAGLEISRRWPADAVDLTADMELVAAKVLHGVPSPTGISSSTLNRGELEDSYGAIERFAPDILVTTHRDLLKQEVIDDCVVTSPRNYLREIIARL